MKSKPPNPDYLLSVSSDKFVKVKEMRKYIDVDISSTLRSIRGVHVPDCAVAVGSNRLLASKWWSIFREVIAQVGGPRSKAAFKYYQREEGYPEYFRQLGAIAVDFFTSCEFSQNGAVSGYSVTWHTTAIIRDTSESAAFYDAEKPELFRSVGLKSGHLDFSNIKIGNVVGPPIAFEPSKIKWVKADDYEEDAFFKRLMRRTILQKGGGMAQKAYCEVFTTGFPKEVLSDSDIINPINIRDRQIVSPALSMKYPTHADVTKELQTLSTTVSSILFDAIAIELSRFIPSSCGHVSTESLFMVLHPINFRLFYLVTRRHRIMDTPTAKFNESVLGRWLTQPS
jgi:hypothetical protein